MHLVALRCDSANSDTIQTAAFHQVAGLCESILLLRLEPHFYNIEGGCEQGRQQSSRTGGHHLLGRGDVVHG